MMIGSASTTGFDYAAHRAETKAQMDAKFAKADTDKSGGISFSEFKISHVENAKDSAKVADRPSAEDIFSVLDADGDGELTASDREQTKKPGGNFTPESFAALLGIQEQEGGKRPPPPPPPSDELAELLTSSSETEDEAESNLIDQLLETLSSSETA
ncbi:MAG: hypothetical protein ABJO09_01865 [Hyphomicrobiales bacterium]